MKLQAKHVGLITSLVGIAACGSIIGVGQLEDFQLKPPASPSVAAGTWRFPENDEVLTRAATRPGEEPGAVHAVVAGKKRSPSEVFTAAGCVACHNPTSGPFYKNLVAGRQVSTAAQLAAWIKNPQRFKPSTQMPNLGAMISDEEAQDLGKWIKDGNPQGPVPADLPVPVALPVNIQ